jgi:ABC-type nickel/cobalt efflux system permease component RcnA
MTPDLTMLLMTAASIGFLHTLLGPDHYIPFIVMAKAQKWSVTKIALITVLSGAGHVASSVVLGFVGIAFGVALSRFEFFESVRGDIAVWALIAFGLVYTIWGIRRAIRNKSHEHIHLHGDGEAHHHEHTHTKEHLHVHEKDGKVVSLTPWVLFTILVFGPCEPLIPILMYPAAKNSTTGLVLTVLVFSVCTIATMLALVLISVYGIQHISLPRWERYSHVIAGSTILFCGIAIQIFGL